MTRLLTAYSILIHKKLVRFIKEYSANHPWASPEQRLLLDYISPNFYGDRVSSDKFLVLVQFELPTSNECNPQYLQILLNNNRMLSLILALPLFGIFKTMAYFGPMKTLIIHPEDSTTTFLSQIYAPLTHKTIIRGGIYKSEIPKLIESHDRVLMLGHGSPYGLLSQGQFPDAGLLIIDDSMALTLKNKIDNVYIWCHADQFVQRHRLTGLNSGMFISEGMEASYYGFDNVDWGLIDQSNDRFASSVSKYINQPIEVLYQKLVYNYELLARSNPIARFNLERLYLTLAGTNKNTNKVIAM